ncbi:hypothetical protein CW745_03235 [Psychromonas sp. psych-6C06]|uniref:sensor domain-containing phosphodiesterase n=1 Tax=Psychromonas sp. psych-6C06 TaxID=2058089 RepID=UPI000C3494DD|nr:EAL domain-containing protein [Psychromonas sp. psych-6C06]PKF62459.1 hypothetical protein CW745_03235 [Psychromonas sp. psych-6C06]
MQLASTFKSGQQFTWQFNLSNKIFNCDPLLPPFLGFEATKKISLGQFFSRFESHQASVISQAFKEVIASQTRFDTQTLINSAEHRYIVDFSIFLNESNPHIVEGSLCYVQPFPSIDLESKFLKEVFLQADNARMLATSDHRVVMANKTFCAETGYKEHELVGQSTRIIKSGQYEPEFYAKLWETVDTTKHWRGELLAKNKQGEVYARDMRLQRFDMEDGCHFYFASSVKLDIPSSQLDLQAPGDHPSNVPDKDSYVQALQKAFKTLSSDQTIVVATFKIKWLQKISEFTESWLILQRFQLSKQQGTLGEISKGIYSIFWAEDKNPDKIDGLLRNLLKIFSDGFDESGFDLFSSVNIGVSILSVDAKKPAQLIAHSMQTLIANPAKDYSSVYYFDPRLSKRFDRNQVLASLLKNALKEKKVEVYYQPIVAIPSLQIEEFEALFRINLDTDLDYDTQELIGIAETYNWIDEIDAMVTKVALASLPKIQQHYQNDNIAMAINRSLANDRVTHCCLQDTIAILLDSKADLSKVTIELTESAVFDNFDQQKQWVEALQKQGAKVAIDDFGTGYSSFAYLHNLSVDYIKIDRSFVTGLTLESNEYTMIEMLCKLAHKMGAKVIAEGVETVDDFRLLSRAKVDLLQGYLFSRPMSLETLLASPITPYSETLATSVYEIYQPTLRDICCKEFTVVEFDERLSSIKKRFENCEDQHFIILDNKQCAGVLCREDYHAAVSPYIGTKGEQKRDLLTLSKRAHQIMRKDFFCLHIDAPIEKALHFFAQHPSDVIIINNYNNTCLGITTAQALLTYQLSESEKADH